MTAPPADDADRARAASDPRAEDINVNYGNIAAVKGIWVRPSTPARSSP